MKNWISSLLIAASFVVLTPAAEARVEEPLWQCGLHFTVSGSDVQVIIGRSKLTGTGLISCVDVAGNVEELPVNVMIKTPLVFPRISVQPNVTVEGLATGIGVATQPSDLLGRYIAVDARVAVGAGLGTSLALRGTENMLAFNLSLLGVQGFGAGVGASVVTITPAN